MACFADINVSQGSVATYARCGGIFDNHLTANLPRNLPMKKILKSTRIKQTSKTKICSMLNILCMLNPPILFTHTSYVTHK